MQAKWMLLALSTGFAFAQEPAFDVASLKPVVLTADLYHANLGTARHGEVTLTNATLSECLRYAYGLSNDSQVAGPDWIKDKSVRFDILAKSAPDTPVDRLLVMLQRLLNERFHLVMHREEKQLAYLSLAVASRGGSLKPAEETADVTGSQVGPGHIVSNHMSMPLLATLLSRFMRQPIVNQTGLKGWYEVKLNWTPDPLEGSSTPGDPGGNSVYRAIQEQLGLKLEAKKGPLEVLVIDHADKVPVAN